MSCAKAEYCRDVGISATVTPLSTSWARELVTSTIGASAVTVTASATTPAFISAFTVATKAPANSIPSRLTEVNPGSVNVTV